MKRVLLTIVVASMGIGAVWAQKTAQKDYKLPAKGVVQEVWEGIKGTALEKLTKAKPFQNGNPTYAKVVDSLDIGEMGDDYGARYTALLAPPKTGEYTFWLSADDAAELSLSTDDTPGKVVKIAELTSYTPRKSFQKRGKSNPVSLEKGKLYYLCVLHKEGGSNDHLAVAWAGPGMEREILAGKYLSPVKDPKKEKALKRTIEEEQKQNGLMSQYLSQKVDAVPAFLDSLSAGDAKLLTKALEEVQDSLKGLSDKEASDRLQKYLKLSREIQASPAAPLSNPAAKQLLRMEELFLKKQPDDVLKKMGPHRLALSLGEIPSGTETVDKTVLLDSKEGKHRSELVSTGFYALPGVPFKVTVPEGMENKQLFLQVGHHIEPNDKRPFISMPSTTRKFDITQKTTEFISPHGGIILLNVPAKMALKKTPFEFSRVIQAPRFVLGETTDEEWKKIRDYPAPWGELVSEHLTMIVPRADLQKLDNPVELMTWWNENNRRHEDFYAYYPGIAFRMHAAYYAREGVSYWPLEWHPENIGNLLDIGKMREKNSALYLHEHGHHADFGDMEFGFSAESTCNWAGYYMKASIPFDWKDDPTIHLCKLMDPENKQHNEIKEPDWYKNPNKGTHHWSYPITSMILGYTEDFGWEPFKKTIHRLRDREGDMYSWPFTGRRSDDQAKIDRYLIGLSEEAKRDVRPYFAHFQMKPSPGAAEYLDKLALPKWDATHLPPPAVTTTKAGQPLTIPAPAKTALTMAGSVKLKWEQPENGTLKENEQGDVIYTPKEGYTGKEKLPYTLETPVGISPVKYITVTVEP